MRLISAKLSGYRRFEEATADLDAPVLAVVGPNEAGKTTLLEALASIEHDEPIPEQYVTRGLSRKFRPADVLIECRFVLEPEERDAIAELPGVGSPRWFVVRKRLNGRRIFVVEPDLKRDLTPRAELRAVLARSLNNTHLTRFLKLEVELDDEGRKMRLGRTFRDLIKEMGTEAETLNPGLLASFRSLKAAFDDLLDSGTEHQRRALKSVGDAVQRFLNVEDAPHPRDLAVEHLERVRPLLLLFRDDDRTLRPEYPSTELAKPAAALENLFSVGGVSAGELHRAIENELEGERAGLQRRANQNLEKRFIEIWNQSNVFPYVQFEPDAVRIHVPTRGTLAPISERSDGLRSFVALVAFTEAFGGEVPPILLIDEAERHLHYEAQADLVQVFERQQVAQKIIYTTHSAGCLPSDLGVGIRAVKPLPEVNGEDSARSTVTSAFWAEGARFSPLLFAMGASVMALVPTRRAVLTEGPSDPILLPSLLRSATGLSSLRFQVAPGLANVSKAEAADLDLEAPRVVHVLDGDQGGRDHARDLRRAGVPKTLIKLLPRNRVLEDYVDPDVYLAAVNEELHRSHGDDARLDIRLRATNRPAQVQEACEVSKWPEPNKVRVASRIVERRDDQRLIDERRRQELRGVYNWIAGKLGLDQV